MPGSGPIAETSVVAFHELNRSETETMKDVILKGAQKRGFTSRNHAKMDYLDYLQEKEGKDVGKDLVRIAGIERNINAITVDLMNEGLLRTQADPDNDGHPLRVRGVNSNKLNMMLFPREAYTQEQRLLALIAKDYAGLEEVRGRLSRHQKQLEVVRGTVV